MTDAQKMACLFIQARFRGWRARKAVKKAHGFECRTMASMKVNQGNYTQSDAEIQAARRLVMQIREGLEQFGYEPAPENYNAK